MALSNVTHASNCADLFENPGNQFVTEQALSNTHPLTPIPDLHLQDDNGGPSELTS